MLKRVNTKAISSKRRQQLTVEKAAKQTSNQKRAQLLKSFCCNLITFSQRRLLLMFRLTFLFVWLERKVPSETVVCDFLRTFSYHV